MNPSTNHKCCTREQLLPFLRSESSSVEQQAIENHLAQCPSCRELLEHSAADRAQWMEASELLGGDPRRTTSSDELSGHVSVPHVLDLLKPTDDPESLGRIGGYEVTGVIGSGGMGVVLKAHDRSLDRTVAIKVMAMHLAMSGTARVRFAREAKAAAAVLHPNVIAIHSVSQDEPLPYLVMPYIRGTSLQKRIDDEGPLSLSELLRVAAQVAAGLAAAHAQGLVHRDIKPANILLEQGVERVSITDFGLARAVDDATMTRSGVIAGTPQYMSPEQARGEVIDARSDLFSLGSLIYAMCTGRPPFRAETTFGVLQRVADDQPRSIREINAAIPQWLGSIVDKLMAKHPDDRYASAEEVRQLLENCLAHVSGPLTNPLPRIRFHNSTERWWSRLMNDKRILSLFAISLLVAAVVLPWPIAALARDEAALMFSASAVLIALFFALLSRTEYLSRLVLKTATAVLGIFALACLVAVPLFFWRSASAKSELARAQQAKIQKMQDDMSAQQARELDLQQPPPAAANAPSPSTSGQSFGPVIERVINHSEDSTSDYFLDLDAGRLVQAPADIFSLLSNRFGDVTILGRRDEPIKAWAQDTGGDLLLAFTSPDVTLSLYGGMIVFPTLSFAEADAEQVRKMVSDVLQQRKQDGKPMPPLTMFHRHELDLDIAFVFHTRDGGIGLLQIVGSTEKPRSVTVRYKLLIGDASLMMEGRSDKVENDAKGTKAAAVTNTFSLRHVLASKMAKDLRQILHGRPGHEAVPSADNRKIIVTAPPKVMERVRSIIVTTDWPDAIERGPDHQYSPLTVTRAARSFFYACAIEDSEEAISNLLSLQVLAQLKGETKSKQFEDFQRGGAANAEWEALLRADWPGKKELIQRLVREWNRYSLQRIVENGAIENSFGVTHYCSVWFEGAPKEFYYLAIEPGRAKPGAREVPYFFSSLPPWWNACSEPVAVTPMPTANDDSTVSAPNSIDHDHRKAVELQQFQGIWSLEFIQTMSWPKPKGKGPDNSGQGSEQQWAIKGNEITWINPRDEEVKLTFTIDPTQSPKHFDVKFVSGPFRGKESQGIYERGGVSGKLLRLCLKDPLLATARPTKFGMDSISRHTLIGLSPATPTPDDAATDEQITAVEGVMALEVGDQVKHQQHPGGPQEPNRQPPQNPDAQRKQEVSTGVLSGRIVYDGEPPVAEDLYPSFAELTIDKPQQRGPDGRYSGVEAIYREYLKHNLRPTTIDPSLRVGKDKGLADVVIWVKSKDIPWSPPPEGQSPVTVQIKDASFVPRAIAVTVGQPLIVENQDPVNQNVSGMFYRTSNPAFNSLLKAGSPNSSRRMTFKSPEPIPNRISLDHCPWASGLVFVHSNPYVAISQEDGSFRIPNLPLGEWEFQAWHPRSGYISDWPGLRGPRRKGEVFTQKITPGENCLRAIKLQPEQFNTRN